MSLSQDWPFGNNIKGTLGSTQVHGICMTLSAHWAKSSLKAGKKLTEPIKVDVNAAAAMHVIRSKEHKIVDSGSGSFSSKVDAWHKVFFERLGMGWNLFASGSGTDYNFTSEHGVYVLTIYGQGGHTMAFARFPSDSVFFDPNFGQFSCHASIFSSFKKDMKEKVTIPGYANLRREWYIYKLTL